MSEHTVLGGSEFDRAWVPTPQQIADTNLFWLMQQAGVSSHADLHAWSTSQCEAFWALVIERLGVHISKPYERVLDLSSGVEHPRWLPGARLNIAQSCFGALPEIPAILFQPEDGEMGTLSYGQLQALTDRVAHGLVRRGHQPGDAIAVVLPMTAEAVAIYLGIVKAGCVVVGIADSFRPREIATRLRLSNAVAVFTQDVTLRGGKTLPLYANVIEAEATCAIVLPAGQQLCLPLRSQDCEWNDFLGPAEPFVAVERDPDDAMNILFSSGTTGDPKVIPWTHTTPLKGAMDAHFHHDVHPNEVLVWPTSLGWMMGPWLIFASLMNKATLGLYYGAPTGKPFGQFVQDANTTLLGLVPSLVKLWRSTGCMDGIDWNSIRRFSSTGECSTADDMHWLMKFSGHKPIVEYCGGTEIGGGYIATVLTKPCVPSTFNAPTLGLDFCILDDDGQPTDNGELFIVPPSIGLSTTLLNQDHHTVYFADTPTGPNGELLRRHGDRMEQFAQGYWRAHGRADDTMNLGGIKVSSAEIERVLLQVPGISEVAAIAVSPDGGPSLLVVYAVPTTGCPSDQPAVLAGMKQAIRQELNPLFKIHDLVLIDALPRTASNKVMRRTLRDRYTAQV